MGFLSAAIFRHADRDGYSMGICEGLKPFVGQLTPRVAVIPPALTARMQPSFSSIT